MQKFVICIEDTGEQYACADSRSVLEGMEALGKRHSRGLPPRWLRRVQRCASSKASTCAA